MTLVREPLQVVELVQPLCAHVYGVAPCTAAGTSKCFNSRKTCQDIVNFELGDPLSIFFVSGDAHRPTPTGFDPSTAIPSLKSVNTAPTVLNVASGDKDFSPLGLRAVANISISDHPYNDEGIDPYAADRGYDIAAQGTFWGRWLARNPYHTGYIVRIYDGYRGEPLAEMIRREYFVDKIDRNPDSVRITAKDVLRRITDTEIKAPEASPGVLAADISDSSTTLTIAGAALSEYPAPGRIRIGGEIIAYATVVESSGNLDFSGLTRGVLDTDAEAHSQDDGAQWILSYEDVRFEAIIYDLLVNKAGIAAAYIDQAAWEEEAEKWRALYSFTRHLTEPYDIHKLVGELVQQSQTHIWWDERQQKIRMEAQRANIVAARLTDTDNIVAASFSIKEDTKDRASRCDVYYGLRNPTLRPTAKTSYKAVEAVIDAESTGNYGESSEKEIFAPWIPTQILARSLATNYVARFKDARKRVVFQVPAKDIESVWTGDVARIEHWLEQLPDGRPSVTPWLVTSAETIEQGGLYKFTAEDNQSAGLLWLWVAEAEYPAQWADATPEQRESVGYWCDADGKNPDGSDSNFRWL